MSLAAVMTTLKSQIAEGWFNRHEERIESIVAAALAGYPRWALNAPKDTIAFSQGWPRPGYRLGGSFRSATTSGKFREGTRYSDAELESRRWWQRSADRVTEQIDRVLRLPTNPTPEQVIDALDRAKVAGVPVGLTRDGFSWIERTVDGWGEFSPNRVGTYQPVVTRSYSYRTSETPEQLAAPALRYITHDGNAPYRFALLFRDYTAVQGSGSIQATSILATSKPYGPPQSMIPDSVKRREVGATGKQAIINGLQRIGWTYKPGSANDYLTDPTNNVRLQIKTTAIHLQTYDYANGEWRGGSFGSVKDVSRDVPKVVERLQRFTEDQVTKAPKHPPILSKSEVESIERYYPDRQNAYRYGHAAARAGVPREEIPAVFDREFDEDIRKAWLRGWDAGFSEGIR
jgi:hypothetical protein